MKSLISSSMSLLVRCGFPIRCWRHYILLWFRPGFLNRSLFAVSLEYEATFRLHHRRLWAYHKERMHMLDVTRPSYLSSFPPLDRQFRCHLGFNNQAQGPRKDQPCGSKAKVPVKRLLKVVQVRVLNKAFFRQLTWYFLSSQESTPCALQFALRCDALRWCFDIGHCWSHP